MTIIRKIQNGKLSTTIGIILIILSGILFGLIFVVPFFPVSLAQKGIFLSILVIGMEITWWVGVALLGKQLITRYRKQLYPCNWFPCKNENHQDKEEDK